MTLIAVHGPRSSFRWNTEGNRTFIFTREGTNFELWADNRNSDTVDKGVQIRWETRANGGASFNWLTIPPEDFGTIVKLMFEANATALIKAICDHVITASDSFFRPLIFMELTLALGKADPAKALAAFCDTISQTIVGGKATETEPADQG